MRILGLSVLLLLLISCNDHTEEIAECLQCDTLMNMTVRMDNQFDVGDDDTVFIVTKKSPDFAPAESEVRLSAGQHSFIVKDTIHRSDSIMITFKGTSHRYYDFKKDWYFMANMFDHNDGRCGLHDYVLDNTQIHESGMMLDFPH